MSRPLCLRFLRRGFRPCVPRIRPDGLRLSLRDRSGHPESRSLPSSIRRDGWIVSGRGEVPAGCPPRLVHPGIDWVHSRGVVGVPLCGSGRTRWSLLHSESPRCVSPLPLPGVGPPGPLDVVRPCDPLGRVSSVALQHDQGATVARSLVFTSPSLSCGKSRVPRHPVLGSGPRVIRL